MSREQRLDELEKAFSQVPVGAVDSAEELARAEMARASRHFGFAQPTFRTSVRLRFSGEGVKGHDLDGGLVCLTESMLVSGTHRPSRRSRVYSASVFLTL